MFYGILLFVVQLIIVPRLFFIQQTNDLLCLFRVVALLKLGRVQLLRNGMACFWTGEVWWNRGMLPWCFCLSLVLHPRAGLKDTQNTTSPPNPAEHHSSLYWWLVTLQRVVRRQWEASTSFHQLHLAAIQWLSQTRGPQSCSQWSFACMSPIYRWSQHTWSKSVSLQCSWLLLSE